MHSYPVNRSSRSLTTNLRKGPKDRFAFRGTLETRDESIARIKAMAIRADLETQRGAGCDRRRPQPAIAATPAIVDMLIAKLRAEVLEADDWNRLASKPLEHLPFLPEELRTIEGDVFETVEKPTCWRRNNTDPLLEVGQISILLHTMRPWSRQAPCALFHTDPAFLNYTQPIHWRTPPSKLGSVRPMGPLATTEPQNYKFT